MNRKKFAGLIIMMLLSIMGIIWVQLVWIKKAIRIRNDSFNYSVNVSLRNAANAIESSRRMSFYNNYMANGPISFRDSSVDILGYWSSGRNSSETLDNVSVNITNQSYTGNSDTGRLTTVNKSFTFNGDTSFVSDSVTFYITASDESGKINVVRKKELQN
jgi:hypothetical protein